MTCKIEGCHNPVYGHGLCAKHYFRQRRHGDAGVTHKPGPKPSKPKPEPRVVVLEGVEVEALRKQLKRAIAEIQVLKRGQASAHPAASPKKAPAKSSVQTDDVEQVPGLRARIAQLEALAAELAEQRDAANDAWSRHVQQRKAHIVLPRAYEPMIRLMSAGLHPDRTRTDKWFKLFKSIPVTIVDEPDATKPAPPPLPQSAEELMEQQKTKDARKKHAKGPAQNATPRRRAVTGKGLDRP